MKKVLLIVFVFTSLLAGEYIKESEKYTLFKSDRDYMNLVEQAYFKKIYSSDELQTALNEDGHHPLSDILRVIAYDEVKDEKNILIYSKNIQENEKLLKKFPPFALALSDIFMRTGEYDKVLLTLPRKEIVMLPQKEKRQAYYYRAMAKYLKDNEISQEFKMIMNHYKITKKIYYTKERKGK